VSRYRFIDAEKATFPVALLCRVLGVARSGYDAALADRVRAIHAASRATYGAPRIHAVLRAEGTRVGRKRVARLMRGASLVGVRRGGPRPPTTIADPDRVAAPNRVARNFRAEAPDRLWVGDLTYVPTGEGWLYLAVLLDEYSRRVVGWAMGGAMPTDLPLAALRMALRRRPAPGLVHHTDRGSQDTALAYQAQLATAGLVASMSRAGDCDDNALAESFFATLKSELVDRSRWPTRHAAQGAIFEWIEAVSNRQLLHSALGYRTPVAFEDRRPPLPTAA
jgi:transposase InsO family protein